MSKSIAPRRRTQGKREHDTQLRETLEVKRQIGTRVALDDPGHNGTSEDDKKGCS